jgi:hypothetical protein|tara:strand:+ start:108 stop:338 length:231 start_codon:yes stop_codon:yes gene_type:complete
MGTTWMIPVNAVSKTVENAVLVTQPVVYGVAAGTVLGLQLNEWIMLGTGVLLIMNLGLAVTKVYSTYKTLKKGDYD